jgi:hypothetical protein
MFETLKIYPDSRTIKSLDPTVALDWGGQTYSSDTVANAGGVTFGGGNPGNKSKAYGGQKVHPSSAHTPLSHASTLAADALQDRQLPMVTDARWSLGAQAYDMAYMLNGKYSLKIHQGAYL